MNSYDVEWIVRCIEISRGVIPHMNKRALVEDLRAALTPPAPPEDASLQGMALITRKRGTKTVDTLARYAPGDTPYPYKDCRREVKRTANVAIEHHRLADVEERLGAQVDILRMALESIAAQWTDEDGMLDDQTTINQRFEDQKLAILALKYARQLDDDRTKARVLGRKL